MGEDKRVRAARAKAVAASGKRRHRLTPSPGMLAEPRRRMILEWMHEEGSARVRDLSDAFAVSEATVRQDLERLEAEGHIIREHGGAFLKSMPQQVRALALHHLVNMDAKARIGAAAAALVNDGETIILDSGSTTTEIAKFLGGRQNLNVITNALNIALTLGAQPSFTIHVTGGQFKAPTLSLSGEKAADFFTGINAEKLFLAAAAVSLDAGLTYPSVADLYVKRAMIESASHTYLVVDSTKIGKKAFSSLGGIELIDTLITDDGITAADRKVFEKANVEVMIA